VYVFFHLGVGVGGAFHEPLGGEEVHAGLHEAAHLGLARGALDRREREHGHIGLGLRLVALRRHPTRGRNHPHALYTHSTNSHL
jgi:hypothetical protein